MTYPVDERRLTYRKLYARYLKSATDHATANADWIPPRSPEDLEVLAESRVHHYFADATVARIVHALQAHGFYRAASEPGDSPGSTDVIRFKIRNYDAPSGSRQVFFMASWADDEPLYSDLTISGYTADAAIGADEDWAYPFYPIRLNTSATNDEILDAVEFIIEYIEQYLS